MLERQQSQLVSAMQGLYHRLLEASAWGGVPLEEAGGHPLTHDILSALNLLEPEPDGSRCLEGFGENRETQQSKLIFEDTGYSRRPFSSGSGHSHHDHSRKASIDDTTVVAKPPLFEENFNPALSNDGSQLCAPGWAPISHPEQTQRFRNVIQQPDFGTQLSLPWTLQSRSPTSQFDFVDQFPPYGDALVYANNNGDWSDISNLCQFSAVGY